MSGETNRLLKLVHADHRPPQRARAGRGRRHRRAGVHRPRRARDPGAEGQGHSFLGHQCRIVTDSTFSKARIKSIDARANLRGAEEEAHRGGRRLPGRRRRGQHHHARPRRLRHHRRRDRRGAQGRRLRDLHRRRRRLHHRPEHVPGGAQAGPDQLRGDARAGLRWARRCCRSARSSSR